MANYSTLSDQELTSLFNQGDEAAFAQIYRRHWPEVYQAAFNRLRIKDLCQDIVQNIFISLWDRRGTVQIENLSAYLKTAVRFQVINAVDRIPAQHIFLESFESLIVSPEQTDDLVLEKEVQQLLRLFIDALPAKRREIFIKRYSENYTTAEIAEQLNISRKTVQNQLHNAEQALRARLSHLAVFSIIVTEYLKR